ncbi:hypothetical protein B0A54_07279 [Friedmanniomyces endolithicus]|uniref:Uncharacterized protein n=1 Tax=Friedmanniomyces endolithicus TaxID=329885 RepID=A0A4U0V0T5_9PEZI|nr:hypothetical protein B0A54_07279 [Friedmanniomyces endolithicus]
MDNSPLAKLAPELRNRIYELALYVPGRSGIKVPLGNRGAQVKNAPLALTKVSREIRADTAKMFYAVNVFTVYAKIFDDMEENEGPDGAMDAAGAAEMPIDRAVNWFAKFGKKNAGMAKRVVINLGTLNAMAGNAGGWLAIAWEAACEITDKENGLFPPGGPTPTIRRMSFAFGIDPQPYQGEVEGSRPHLEYRFRYSGDKAATRRDLRRTRDMMMERVEMDEDLTDQDCHWLETVFLDWHKIIVKAVAKGSCSRRWTDDDSCAGR